MNSKMAAFQQPHPQGPIGAKCPNYIGAKCPGDEVFSVMLIVISFALSSYGTCLPHSAIFQIFTPGSQIAAND